VCVYIYILVILHLETIDKCNPACVLMYIHRNKGLLYDRNKVFFNMKKKKFLHNNKKKWLYLLLSPLSLSEVFFAVYTSNVLIAGFCSLTVIIFVMMCLYK